MLPLPEGEGWGEGERHVQCRCAFNGLMRFPDPVPTRMSVMTSFGNVRYTVLALLLFVYCLTAPASEPFAVLNSSNLVRYVERFNAMEDENVTNFVPNLNSAEWMTRNIPLFDCPDSEFEEIYYFRWWSFRKHIVKTPAGFVITEFLTPVRHAGPYNTISCATGFHIAEGRWLRDSQYVNDYIQFWVRGNSGKPQTHFHKYSSWFADAIYNQYLVSGDKKLPTDLLDDLVADYRLWEQERKDSSGLFWQFDVRDGMEESISGSRTNKNLRPTINSYMFANARAIAAIGRLAGKGELATQFDATAAELKAAVQKRLWNSGAEFFEVLRDTGQFSNAREEIGFIPWMFELPDAGRENAWKQLLDPQGFRAPYGITTAERRHPQFRSHGVGTCEWDGAIWPFGTSQTLVALANVLQDHHASVVSPRDYFDALATYVHSQHSNGKPYIGEYLDEVTGDWINGKGGRSRYYNHSTFADLIITGLVGLHPRSDATVEISPLVPEGVWNSFCLDGVKYHDHVLTIIWDRDGSKYHRGSGFRVLADGKEIAKANQLQRISGKL